MLRLCEYAPRELALATGANVFLACGGRYDMALAGERELPSSICPLIKSFYGFLLEKKCPFLEMSDMILGETTCDGKKKVYELVATNLKRNIHVMELPQVSGVFSLKCSAPFWTCSNLEMQLFVVC